MISGRIRFVEFGVCLFDFFEELIFELFHGDLVLFKGKVDLEVGLYFIVWVPDILKVGML